jgi:hypothetical protein
MKRTLRLAKKGAPEAVAIRALNLLRLNKLYSFRTVTPERK